MSVGAAILVFLWSTFKYVLGVGFALTTLPNHFAGFVCCTTGAMVGVSVFTYGGLWLNERMRRFWKKGSHFNRRNRLLIKIKHNGGLPLLAILTPVIISIPVGCILATTFVHNRHKIVLWMWAMVWIYSLVIFGSMWLFNLNLAEWIMRR
ncbi:MAG: hypothetical protein JNL57_07285 [Bacteroidetes bacterium]|nr:hypothetical protein [Bacteroidota bacterium]